MKHYIIKRVPADCFDSSWEFDGDFFNGKATGEYTDTLFIIDRDYRSYTWHYFGLNSEEYENILCEIAGRIEDGILDSQKFDEDDFDSVAVYLGIKTGKPWSALRVRGCVQGAEVTVVYCTKRYTEKRARREGEIWLGFADEFRITALNDDGSESYTYTEFVANSEGFSDDDCKRVLCEACGIDESDCRFEDEDDDDEDGSEAVDMLLRTAEISFEISESILPLDRIIVEVEKAYPAYKFSRTESRYESCVMAIFERRTA